VLTNQIPSGFSQSLITVPNLILEFILGTFMMLYILTMIRKLYSSIRKGDVEQYWWAAAKLLLGVIGGIAYTNQVLTLLGTNPVFSNSMSLIGVYALLALLAVYKARRARHG